MVQLKHGSTESLLILSNLDSLNLLVLGVGLVRDRVFGDINARLLFEVGDLLADEAEPELFILTNDLGRAKFNLVELFRRSDLRKELLDFGVGDVADISES